MYIDSSHIQINLSIALATPQAPFSLPVASSNGFRRVRLIYMIKTQCNKNQYTSIENHQNPNAPNNVQIVETAAAKVQNWQIGIKYKDQQVGLTLG